MNLEGGRGKKIEVISLNYSFLVLTGEKVLFSWRISILRFGVSIESPMSRKGSLWKRLFNEIRHGSLKLHFIDISKEFLIMQLFFVRRY